MKPIEIVQEINQSRITINNLKNSLNVSRKNVEKLTEENNNLKETIEDLNVKYNNLLEENNNLKETKSKPYKIIYL